MVIVLMAEISIVTTTTALNEAYLLAIFLRPFYPETAINCRFYIDGRFSYGDSKSSSSEEEDATFFGNRRFNQSLIIRLSPLAY